MHDFGLFKWLHVVETELINKLNFLEDEDQETPPVMNTNPFDELDGDLHSNHLNLNPFGDPDEEGKIQDLDANNALNMCNCLPACLTNFNCLTVSVCQVGAVVEL